MNCKDTETVTITLERYEKLRKEREHSYFRIQELEQATERMGRELRELQNAGKTGGDSKEGSRPKTHEAD